MCVTSIQQRLRKYNTMNSGVKITFLGAQDKLNFSQYKQIFSPNVQRASKKIQCKVLFPWMPGPLNQSTMYWWEQSNPIFIIGVQHTWYNLHLFYVHICISDSALSVQISDKLFGNRTSKNLIVLVRRTKIFRFFLPLWIYENLYLDIL